MMTKNDDEPEFQSALAKKASELAPRADRLIEVGYRCLVAGGLGLVPGVGAAIREVIAAQKEQSAAKNFEIFVRRVELIEERIGEMSGAAEFLQSPPGREHISRIFEAAQRAEGERHRDAVAAAFVSGAGYGRFQPDVVLLLDEVVARMSEYHVAVLGWCREKQGTMPLAKRLYPALTMRQLVDEAAVPAAIVQKIVGDLIDRRVLMDGGINKVGGYWGVLSFSLTSFGVAFGRYLSSPEDFASGEPELESPFPPETIK